MLEPTSIMGFGQYLDILNGATLDTGGVAFDLDLPWGFRAGASATRREWTSPVIGGGVPSTTRDLVIEGYVQRSFLDRLSVSAGAYHESAESTFFRDAQDFRLTTFPVSVRFFDPRGPFAILKVEPGFHTFTDAIGRGSENFVSVDFGVGMRLPNERGLISLEIQNVLDQDIRLRERVFGRDIFAVPRFAPDLTLTLRGTLNL